MAKNETQAEEQRAIDLEESGNEVAALEVWLRLAHQKPSAVFYCRAGGGLDNFGARYYASLDGRFMSPDPANAGANPGRVAGPFWSGFERFGIGGCPTLLGLKRGAWAAIPAAS